MRELPAAVLEVLERRQSVIAVPMVYIEARRRRDDGTLGQIEGVGLWRGETDEDIIARDLFTGHEMRRAFFASSLLDIAGVQFEAGLSVRPIKVRLSSISEPVLAAIRQYDARGAQVQGWRRYYDPDTRKPLGKPVPLFKGYANRAPSERPAPGGEASLELEVVTTARTLTITSGLKKSHAAQQRRDGDMLNRYKGTVGTWSIPWGVKDEKGRGGDGGGGGGGGDNGPGYDDGGH
jgi:hypothetical protein